MFLLSRRRMLFILCLFLTCSAAVLLRPVRSWIDRAIVTTLISENLKVDKLYFHFSQGVVEAPAFQLDYEQDGTAFCMEGKAWVAVDYQPLLFRRFQASKILLEDTRMVMKHQPQSYIAKPNTWDTMLADRLAQLDWQLVSRKLDSLLALRDLTPTWKSRIDRWVIRSREIVTRAQSLEDRLEELDNPLRFEGELRKRLKKLTDLRSEQDVLVGQFEQVQRLLEIETTRISEMKTVDINKINQLAAMTAQSNQEELSELSRELITEIASIAWHRYAPFALVPQRMSDIALTAPEADSSFTVHSNGASANILSLPAIAASGTFEHDETDYPFHAIGKYSLSQQTGLNPQASMDWQVTYQVAAQRSNSIDVAIQNNVQPGRQYRITMKVGEDPASSAMAAEFTSGSSEVDGLLTFNLEHLAELDLTSDRELDKQISAFLDQSELHSTIELSIHGTWNHPRIELHQELPEELFFAVQKCMSQQLADAKDAALTSLETDFESEREQVRKLVQKAVIDGKATAAKHQMRIESAEHELVSRLDEMTGAGFASRATTINR